MNTYLKKLVETKEFIIYENENPNNFEKLKCIKCKKCGTISYNSNDVKKLFCGKCKIFFNKS